MANPTVIFVDDSQTALASTKIATATMPIVARQYLSAQEALQEIESGAVVPDLIIADLKMPIMDGLEFLKTIRNTEGIKKVPFLMLSAEVKESSKTEAKMLGITGWIQKPFNPAQLKAAINRVLRMER